MRNAATTSANTAGFVAHSFNTAEVKFLSIIGASLQPLNVRRAMLKSDSMSDQVRQFKF